MSKFYTYYQSNSGGFYHINDMVAEFVIVEANSVKESEARMDVICKDYYFGCGCGICSERWGNVGWLDDDDGTDYPEIRGVPPEAYRYKGVFDYSEEKTCVIHYLNGLKKYINYNGKLTSPIKKSDEVS